MTKITFCFTEKKNEEKESNLSFEMTIINCLQENIVWKKLKSVKDEISKHKNGKKIQR